MFKINDKRKIEINFVLFFETSFWTYRFLDRCFEFVTTLRVVRNVEWMITRRTIGILATFDNKSVSLATNDGHFGNEKSVDEPGNTPALISCLKTIKSFKISVLY